jgi:hypothetical protein
MKYASLLLRKFHWINLIGCIGPGEMGNALHYREFHWINLVGFVIDE